LGEEAASAGPDGLEVQNLYNISILNALWKIISGTRYDYRDPQLIDLTRKVNEAMLTLGPKFSLTFIMPWLRIFGIDRQFAENTKRFRAIRDFISATIEQHQATFNSGEMRDYIDVYLSEIETETDPESSFYKEKGIENLIQALSDLFFAGSETTSSTLSWATLYMMRHPEVQSKVREEIFRVVGKERLPSLSDKQLMPYTEATMLEIQRLGNIAPFGLPHSTYQKELSLRGKVIPKAHTVMVNMGGIMKSDRGWKDSKNFNPDRHLSPENGNVIHDERIIPFLIGKRQCPGESLARAEIFLYLTGLLQKFEFRSIDPSNPPSTDFLNGLTAVPLPFKAKVFAF
jgi:cytochrome P450